ncbi:MAG TPA: DUF1818 family protein [Stenomitos sp.]
MGKQIRSGPGWRVGWDADADLFQALLGADDWAVELTQVEFDEFCRLAQQLSETVAQMRSELMDEEAIACEVKSDSLWMEVRGYPDAYQLSFIALTGRRVEGSWSVEATREVLRTIRTAQMF